MNEPKSLEMHDLEGLIHLLADSAFGDGIHGLEDYSDETRRIRTAAIALAYAGDIPPPESAMASESSQQIAKEMRDAAGDFEPWGRDILEAFAARLDATAAPVVVGGDMEAFRRVIQKAADNIQVPKMTTARSEYWKAGARAAITSFNDALTAALAGLDVRDAARFREIMRNQWLRHSRYGDQVMGWREKYLAEIDNGIKSPQRGS